MEIWKLLLFIPACFALNMTPGPNNLLSMNNARCYGFQAAFVAGLGRILAFSGMIALAASGLAVVLYTSETLFSLSSYLARCTCYGSRSTYGAHKLARSRISNEIRTGLVWLNKNLHSLLAIQKRYSFLLHSFLNLSMFQQT